MSKRLSIFIDADNKQNSSELITAISIGAALESKLITESEVYISSVKPADEWQRMLIEAGISSSLIQTQVVEQEPESADTDLFCTFYDSIMNKRICSEHSVVYLVSEDKKLSFMFERLARKKGICFFSNTTHPFNAPTLPSLKSGHDDSRVLTKFRLCVDEWFKSHEKADEMPQSAIASLFKKLKIKSDDKECINKMMPVFYKNRWCGASILRHAPIGQQLDNFHESSI